MNPGRNRRKLSFLLLLWAFVLLSGANATAKPQPGKGDRFCRTLRSMARVYMAYGAYDKAQPLVEQAMAIAEVANISETELYLCMIDLAYVYDKQGRLVEAESMCKSGLGVQSKVLGDDHPYGRRPSLRGLHDEDSKFHLSKAEQISRCPKNSR